MKLDMYFARRFIFCFCLVGGVFLGIVVLIDMIEHLRRFNNADVGIMRGAQLAMLHAPTTIYQMLPLLVILATITLFLGLARSSEMVITRAAGRSAIRSAMSPMMTALLFGVLAVAVLNPIVAATAKQYETVLARYVSSETNVSSISDEGLWLRQGSRAGQVVIRAKNSNLDGTQFFGVTFYGFTLDGSVDYRIEASQARLTPGAWRLTDAKRWTFGEVANPEQGAVEHPELLIPSDLTRDQIRDSFGDPEAIPIWELPDFIAQLDHAGFSALKHRVWLNIQLANPVLLAAMVLIGAGFTMRHTRFGRTGLMILFAVLTGFSIFFLRNFAQVLGENGQIPIIVAAWAPPLAGIFMSLGLLLHTEDG